MNKLSPYQLITGSSDGGFTDRMLCDDIITFAESYGVPAEKTLQAYRDLAATDDDECSPDEYEDLITDYLDMPVSCSLQWQDNELRVTPYIDDDLPRLADYPMDYVDDVIYMVNDHGNVTCQEWTGKAYRTVWDMV